MKVLQNDPWNLRNGDKIITRIASENDNGWSVPVLSRDFVTMVQEPKIVEEPELENEGEDTIRISWRPVTQEGKYNYEVFEDIDGDGNFRIYQDTL